MNCPSCGQSLPPNTEFCFYCGQSLKQSSSQNRNAQTQGQTAQNSQNQQSQQTRQSPQSPQYSQTQQVSSSNQPQYAQDRQNAGYQQAQQTSPYDQPQYAQVQQNTGYQQAQQTSPYDQPQYAQYQQNAGYQQTQQTSPYDQPQYAQYRQNAGYQQAQQTSPYDQPQYAQYQQAQSYYGQPLQTGYGYQNAVQPKKKKTGLIIGISVGLVVVIVAAVVLFFVFFNGGSKISGVFGGNQKQIVSGPAEGFVRDNENAAGTPDLNGTYADGVYTNQWADLRFDVPEGWEESNLSDMVVGQGSMRLFIDVSGKKYVGIGFASIQNLGLNGLSESEFLAKMIERSTYSAGTTDISKTEWTLATIGGHSYCGADLHLTDKLSGRSEVGSVYVRYIGQYCITIATSGETIEDADEVMQMIRAY